MPIGDLFRKNARQIRRMDQEKDKSGLSGLYLTHPYTLKEDEDTVPNDDLERCIKKHIREDGMSREEARKHCETPGHEDLPATP